jgi:peptide/nickel transport system ATP-binding protein
LVRSVLVPSLLEVKDLKTYFHTEEGIVPAVDGVDFTIEPEKTLGVVGESGCGKSITALSIMGLIEVPGRIEGGEIRYRRDGEVIDLSKLDPQGAKYRSIRGKEIAMVFQEPMISLTPVYTIGYQIMEAVLLHQGLEREDAQRHVVSMLEAVKMPSPEEQFYHYPHQLSGGMRQRAMIAMALSCNPTLLIADEPTTALDVTVEAQVLDLIRQLGKEFQTSMMLITHDLGVVASVADEVVVMYRGKIVEGSSVREVFHNPQHPYTQGLMASVPSLTSQKRRLVPIKGVVPDPLEIVVGCDFATRCPHAMEICREKEPALKDVTPGHRVACWLYEQ